VRTIENEVEALRAINYWRELAEPLHMKVEATIGLTQEQVDHLREFIHKHEAHALLLNHLSTELCHGEHDYQFLARITIGF
jgi:hypothetical protein